MTTKHQRIAKLTEVALQYYGGTAHLKQITDKIVSLAPKIFKDSKAIEAEIRDVIQKYSSDSKKYRYDDLFQSVYGVSANKGYWRLRESYDNARLYLASDESAFKEKTTATREIEVRLVQKDFRAKLIQKYQATCPLTDISIPIFLVASHIKPWSKSTPEERQDVNNGILLSVHMDKLFDIGEISFDDEGCILFKNDIIRNLVNDNFNLKTDRIVVNKEMCNYLKWHRNNFSFNS